jgi:hypothetical protein
LMHSYASIKFLLFAFLFSFGWITGWGFSRARYYTIFWSIWLLCTQIYAVSNTQILSGNDHRRFCTCTRLFILYHLYAELIRNMNEQEKIFTWFLFIEIVLVRIVLY